MKKLFSNALITIILLTNLNAQMIMKSKHKNTSSADFSILTTSLTWFVSINKRLTFPFEYNLEGYDKSKFNEKKFTHDERGMLADELAECVISHAYDKILFIDTESGKEFQFYLKDLDNNQIIESEKLTDCILFMNRRIIEETQGVIYNKKYEDKKKKIKEDSSYLEYNSSELLQNKKYEDMTDKEKEEFDTYDINEKGM